MKYEAYEIIKIFVEKHPYLYNKMREVDHSLNHLNPYHMEGSIWTHTMMVMKEAENKGNVMLFSALCHDFGKCFVYKDNEETGRRRFSNHEAVSTFYTKEVLESFELDELEKLRIIKTVALHGSLFNYVKDGRIEQKFHSKIAEKYTVTELADIVRFYECDHSGRFFDKTVANESKHLIDDLNTILDICEILHSTKVVNHLPEMVLMIGTPRSGKSTVIKNQYPNHILISRDEFVMEIGKGSTYNECWKSLTEDDQATIDKMLMKKYQDSLKTNKEIVIDMTNMSKKTRKKWMSNKHRMIAHLVIEPKSVVMSRMNDEKSIPDFAIDSMMERFSWPLLDEFESIRIEGF